MEQFINEIKHANLQFAIRRLRKLLGKRYKNQQHINFLHTAKQHQVTPVFCKIRVPKHLNHLSTSITKWILKKELQVHYIRQTEIDTKLKFLHRHLLENHLHQIEYSILIEDFEEEVRR